MYHVVTNCPDCGSEFIVPAPEDIKLPSEVVKFVCPECKRKLSATPEQMGTAIPCPFSDCGAVLHVPDPQFKRIDIPERDS